MELFSRKRFVERTVVTYASQHDVSFYQQPGMFLQCIEVNMDPARPGTSIGKKVIEELGINVTRADQNLRLLQPTL